MNNWICYGHLDYYVLIEFELYHYEVNVYLRNVVRFDNRLIFRLWNLIHTYVVFCKSVKLSHKFMNLQTLANNYFWSQFSCSKPWIVFLTISEIISYQNLKICIVFEPFFETSQPTDITWYLFFTHLWCIYILFHFLFQATKIRGLLCDQKSP